MRYAAGHAADTRARLLALATRTLRAKGAAAVGIQPLMRAAGMTHGGFYTHFASREVLLAETVAALFADTAARAPAGDDGPVATLRRFVQRYLSPAHAADLEGGCPLPALAGEAPRLPDAAAVRYRDGVDAMVARVAAMLVATDRDAALARPLLAELAGAVMLARLERDADARAAMLATARAAALARLGL